MAARMSPARAACPAAITCWLPAGRGIEERFGRTADGGRHGVAEKAEELLDQLPHVDAFLDGRVQLGQCGGRVAGRRCGPRAA